MGQPAQAIALSKLARSGWAIRREPARASSSSVSISKPNSSTGRFIRPGDQEAGEHRPQLHHRRGQEARAWLDAVGRQLLMGLQPGHQADIDPGDHDNRRTSPGDALELPITSPGSTDQRHLAWPRSFEIASTKTEVFQAIDEDGLDHVRAVASIRWPGVSPRIPTPIVVSCPECRIFA